MGETAAGTRLESLESCSPALFLVAGAILVVYATLHGTEAFLDAAYPMVRDGVIRPVGYALGFVAVLGLYPSLADRSPKLARVGGVFTALGTVGWVVMGFVGSSRGLAAHLGYAPPAWLGVFGLLIALGFVVGFPAFGVASLHTGQYPRTVGLLLLAPLLVMATNAAVVIGDFVAVAIGRFLVSTGDALIVLALGIALGTDGTPIDRAEPQPAEVHHD